MQTNLLSKKISFFRFSAFLKPILRLCPYPFAPIPITSLSLFNFLLFFILIFITTKKRQQRQQKYWNKKIKIIFCHPSYDFQSFFFFTVSYSATNIKRQGKKIKRKEEKAKKKNSNHCSINGMYTEKKKKNDDGTIKTDNCINFFQSLFGWKKKKICNGKYKKWKQRAMLVRLKKFTAEHLQLINRTNVQRKEKKTKKNWNSAFRKLKLRKRRRMNCIILEEKKNFYYYWLLSSSEIIQNWRSIAKNLKSWTAITLKLEIGSQLILLKFFVNNYS